MAWAEAAILGIFGTAALFLYIAFSIKGNDFLPLKNLFFLLGVFTIVGGIGSMILILPEAGITSTTVSGPLVALFQIFSVVAVLVMFFFFLKVFISLFGHMLNLKVGRKSVPKGRFNRR